MSHSFHTLIHKIAIAKDELQLRLNYMDMAGDLFDSPHWGIYLYDSPGKSPTIDLQGLPDSFIDYYQSIGAAIDPIMDYVSQNHAPAHEEIIFSPSDWKQSQLYQIGCGKIYDHEHIMTGPIVGQGKLIGTVHFARTSGTPAFDMGNLMQLSAICAHISTKLAFLRSQSGLILSEKTTCLTPRELQIASLVANGLTNAEIAAELWISQNTVKQTLKRIFQKLSVSARAEMVAKLQLAR